MLLKNRAPTRRIFSSLRRRSTVQNEQESHKHESCNQQAIYENADKLLECFIIPNLIRRATSPCHPNPYPTLRINRLGSHYFYQIGEYEHFIPSDFVLDDEIIRTALKCAPSHGLVVDRREVTFSMYIEWKCTQRVLMRFICKRTFWVLQLSYFSIHFLNISFSLSSCFVK